MGAAAGRLGEDQPQRDVTRRTRQRQAFHRHGIEIPDVCLAPLVAVELARHGQLVGHYVAGWIIDAEPTQPRHMPARTRPSPEHLVQVLCQAAVLDSAVVVWLPHCALSRKDLVSVLRNADRQCPDATRIHVISGNRELCRCANTTRCRPGGVGTGG